MDQSLSTQELTSHWTEEHFICFVLLYAAHADFEFSNEEREFICGRVGEPILSETEILFQRLTEYQQLDLIMKLKNRFVIDEENKARILSRVKELFEVDGSYSKLEKTLYSFLSRLI